MIVRYSSILLLLLTCSVWANDCTHVNQVFNIGTTYYKNKNYLLSLTTLSPIILNKCSKDISNKSYLYSIRSAYELNDRHLLNLLLLEFNADPIYKAFFLNDSTYSKYLNESQKLKLLIWNTRHNESDFNNVTGKESLISSSLVSEYKDIYQIEKSPLLAGVLSTLIPGAGHIYVGAYQAGILSFFLNTLMGLVVYELYDEDLEMTATVGAVGFSIIYVGNIISSVKAAKAYNKSLYYEADEKLKKAILPEIYSF